ncbi:MAG: T9SS type A sorting domain-containing protein [Arcicella sp.]|nr:T9SS type A sorting domain-containing protein [Arcicella sp.]
MKYLFSSLLILFTLNSFSQRFYNILFDQLPQDYQLYPRDDKNQAIVPINGTIEVAGWSYMSVVVYRNKKLYSYVRNSFAYDNTGKLGKFSLSPIIKAELAEYDFQIYASQAGKDSVLTFERKNVVSGDAYLIYGQSNGRAWEEVYDYKNEYCRTFGYGSFQNGYSWGLSNEGFTGGFDGEQFIVGEWGIHLQKNILENYGIPTCVINASTSGANIKALSDRNSSNPADIKTSYGRLIYMAQKSGIVNNIKGFFYWQGETDAVQDPNYWKIGFQQLYGFWEKDLPSVKKIYSFQLPLFGAGEYNDEVGALRDYYRQLGKIYPKITPYTPIGVTGWNGWHFDLAGYKQIANELSVIVGKDFYGEKKTLISPNVQKIFYSNEKRDEITMAFESGQQMVYPKDTLVPNIGGGFGMYSLKDFFYLNKVWQKVASGRAEGNKIILKLKQPAETSDTLLKYLPSIYPYSGGSFILKEAPWIYIGPFLKNSDGMRAFAFHHTKVAPFVNLEKITLSSTTLANNKISLKWNNIPNAKGYILERILAKDSTQIQFVKQFPNSAMTFTDSTLEFGTEYIYRIKSFTDLQESEFSILKVKSVNDPNLLSVNVSVNYFNTATLIWQPSSNITKPDFYTIDRKIEPNGAFEQIAKVLGNVNSYKDSTLKANTNYSYRIKAVGNNVAFQGQTDLKTPALLNSPEVIANVLYYNSLKINWKTVVGAVSYKLERKTGTESFKEVTTFDNKTTEFTDKTLKDNTEYTYRLKAFGDKTESLETNITIKTPALLSTPELSVESLTFESLKVVWKTVVNANKYVLERQSSTDTNFNKVFETPNLTEYRDINLKNNETYSYRLKAFSDVSESVFVKIDTKTLVILANQNEENETFKVYPNPTKDYINIIFSKPTSGEFTFTDLVGKNLFTQSFIKQSALKMDISRFQKGLYFLILNSEQQVFYRKVIIE